MINLRNLSAKAEQAQLSSRYSALPGWEKDDAEHQRRGPHWYLRQGGCCGGRLISAAIPGSHVGDGLRAARCFEIFRMNGTLPGQPDLSRTSRDRLAGTLRSGDMRAARQRLLAVRLTDAPETGVPRARDAVRGP
jgi:hypothetical protein